MNNNFYGGNTQFPHSASGQAGYPYNSSYNVLNPQILQGSSLLPSNASHYGLISPNPYYDSGPSLNSIQHSNHSMPAPTPRQYQSLSSAHQYSNNSMPATAPQQYHNHQSLGSVNQYSNNSMPATTPQQYHYHQPSSSVHPYSNYSMPATTSRQYHNYQSLNSVPQYSNYSMPPTIPQQQYNNFVQSAQQSWPNVGNTSSVQSSQQLSGNTFTYNSGNSVGGFHCTNSSGNNSVAGMNAISEYIKNYVRIVTNYEGPVCACPICLCDCELNDEDMVVVALLRCGHQLHSRCLNEMLINQPNNQFMKCPVCKAIIYGEETGNQPPGVMNAVTINQSLPGYPNVKTIQITYQISSGTQGPEHPNPGKRYHAHGFPRICYLPDTEKGRLVLHLLNVAFKRRLIFTVGRSATTNHDNSVVWNDIHHKTSMSEGGYGYPDPSYLDRCLHELAVHGVTHDGPIPCV